MIAAREKALVKAKSNAQVLMQENRKLIEELYLRVLSRFPSAPELECAHAYVTSPGRTFTESVQDLTWALINSKEFILKH